MLNVNVQKIAQARKALISKQQYDNVVSQIEAYFNDERNFLNAELSVTVTLTQANYQLLVPQLQAVGLLSRAEPQQDRYTVYFSEEIQPPCVEEVIPQTPPVTTIINQPVQDIFQPSVDPIFEQAPVTEEVLVEIKDSLQKPTATPVVSSNNTQNLFVMPDDHLTYNDSPF